MRVFQILHKYKLYIDYFESRYDVEELQFKEHLKILIEDRFYGCHILKPCINMDKDSFYTMWNYENLQLKWAKENGLNTENMYEILFAQIEEFQPDVFYNMSPIFFKKSDLEKNISKSILKIAWFASPEMNNIEFDAYKTRLTNYPPDVTNSNAKKGFRSDLFNPSFDEKFDEFNIPNEKRSNTLLFYGQYLKSGFDFRNDDIDKLLEYKINTKSNISIHLQYSETSVVRNKTIGKVFRKLKLNTNSSIFYVKHPKKLVTKNSDAPLFGLDLHSALTNAKMVFNFPVDFTGKYNVNMRNFEALSAGCHLITKRGIYPEGFIENVHYSGFDNFNDFIKVLKYYEMHPELSREIAKKGNAMIRDLYSKENQWEKFKKIVSEVG